MNEDTPGSQVLLFLCQKGLKCKVQTKIHVHEVFKPQYPHTADLHTFQ